MWIYTIELQYNDRYFVLVGSPRSSMNAVEQNVSGPGQAQICWWLGCSEADLIFSKEVTQNLSIYKMHTLTYMLIPHCIYFLTK